MSLRDVIDDIDRQLPQFNDKLLLEYNKNLIDSCPNYVDLVFRHAVEYINDALISIANDSTGMTPYAAPVTYVEPTTVTYDGYRIMSPAEQVRYELNKGLSKDKVSIERDEKVLVEYSFRINNELYTVALYLPYWINNGLIMNGKTYAVKHVLCDKIVRIPSGDGVMLRVMRSPLHFWRNEEIVLKDIHGKETSVKYITVKAHYKNNTNKMYKRTPLVLYLLAEFGFSGAMSYLGYGDDRITLSQTADENDDVYLYFLAVPGVYVKCEAKQFGGIPCKRIVASLVYILRTANTDIQSFDQLFGTKLYTATIGKIIYGNEYSYLQAYGHGYSHLDSLKTYVDSVSQKEFRRDYNIDIKNVYDLFRFVFFNIDNWLTDFSPNNLFEKKLGNVDKLLRASITTALFNRIYKAVRGKELKPKSIADALRIPSIAVNGIYADESIATGTEAYNDDMLFNQLCHKLLQTKKKDGTSAGNDSNTINHKEHQFSPTFVAIESILSISTSNPGVAGDINPFAQITDDGCFDESKMPWYEQIKGLRNLLVPL